MPIPESQYSYLEGDSNEILKTFSNGMFDLIITSPPYNIGKEYETKKSIEAYLKDQESIIKELVRLTSDKGSICWQVGNFVDQRQRKFSHWTYFYYKLFKKHGMKLRIGLSGILVMVYMLHLDFQEDMKQFYGLQRKMRGIFLTWIL